MESKAELRRELVQAIANVREQINVQETAPGGIYGGMGMNGDAVALQALRTELAQLEDALAGLGSDGDA